MQLVCYFLYVKGHRHIALLRRLPTRRERLLGERGTRESCGKSTTTSTHPQDGNMALVFGVASTKGGSGKTTLTINLARAIQQEGRQVQIIDTDPQRTASRWENRQPDGYELPVCHVEDAPTAVSLQSRIMLLQEESEVAVVDGSPKNDGSTAALIRASHAVIIPVQPTPADTWAARPVIEMVRRTNTPAAFVISRQIVGTNLADAVSDSLSEHDIPVFENRASQRVAFAETMVDGITVMDRSSATKARKEVRGIATELIDLVKRQLDAEVQP